MTVFTPLAFEGADVSVEEVRANAAMVKHNGGANPGDISLLRSASTTWRRQASDILKRSIVEKRGLHASEQRDVDALDGIANECDDALIANRNYLDESANARDSFERRTGGGLARNSRLGVELRRAIEDVKGGKSAAFVDYEDRSLLESGTGGYGVATQMGEVVYALAAKSALMSIPGIIKVNATSGDRYRFPRFNAVQVGGTAEGAALTAANTDLDAIDIVFQKFSTYETMSTELDEDFEAPALEALGARMLKDLAARVDNGLIQGTGAADTVGIFSQPGVSSTSVAVLPTDLDKVDEAIYQMELNDGDPGAWIMHPRSWRILNQIKTGISGDKTTLLAPNPQEAARSLRSMPVFTTSAISITSGAGAGSTAALVDPSQIVIVTRRPARLEVSRDVAFATDSVAIRATTRLGLGILDAAGGVSLLTDIRAS